MIFRTLLILLVCFVCLSMAYYGGYGGYGRYGMYGGYGMPYGGYGGYGMFPGGSNHGGKLSCEDQLVVISLIQLKLFEFFVRLSFSQFRARLDHNQFSCVPTRNLVQNVKYVRALSTLST